MMISWGWGRPQEAATGRTSRPSKATGTTGRGWFGFGSGPDARATRLRMAKLGDSVYWACLGQGADRSTLTREAIHDCATLHARSFARPPRHGYPVHRSDRFSLGRRLTPREPARSPARPSSL